MTSSEETAQPVPARRDAGPRLELEDVPACDLCGSRDRRPFETYRRGGHEFALLECDECGLAYVSPRPTEQSIAALYDEVYDATHETYDEPRWSRAVTPALRKLLRMRYGDRPARRRLATAVVPWERRWRRILGEQHLDHIEGIGSVLDVGCGRGYWLATMSRWGFDCVGCEPDARVAADAAAGGLDVRAADLAGAGFASGRFDVVRFADVLEHVHSPRATLSEAARVVRDGGIVVVTAPNHAGLLGHAFKETEDVPRHLFAFSVATLCRYLEEAGLEVVETATFTPELGAVYRQFLPGFDRALSGRADKEDVMAQAYRLLIDERAARDGEFRRLVDFIDSVGLGCSLAVVGRKPTKPTSTSGAVGAAP